MGRLGGVSRGLVGTCHVQYLRSPSHRGLEARRAPPAWGAAVALVLTWLGAGEPSGVFRWPGGLRAALASRESEGREGEDREPYLAETVRGQK